MESRNGLRILVVEDEVFISMLLEDMLMDLGCAKVDVAASVDKALETLAVVTPDFAILDINLNGQKSFPVADLLNARDVPFVYISGYGELGLEGGGLDIRVLQKPFRLNDLRAVIDDALAGQKEALGSL
jgi:DNA-binding response OmpR family regulator